MATLNERLSRLEASSPKLAGEAFHFPSLKAVAGDDMLHIGFALEDGYWPNVTERPEVAAMLECEALTAEQGAVLGAVAREVMASEQPKGAGCGGTRVVP